MDTLKIIADIALGASAWAAVLSLRATVRVIQDAVTRLTDAQMQDRGAIRNLGDRVAQLEAA